MIYLISQILFYVIAAAVLGLFVGWLLTRNAADRRELSLRADWESHMSGVRSLQSEMAAKIRSAEEQLAQQEAQIDAMRIRISDTDRVNARKTADIKALSTELEAGQQKLQQFTEALAKAADINKRLEAELAAAQPTAAEDVQPEIQQQLDQLRVTLRERESDLVQLGAFNEELESQLKHYRQESKPASTKEGPKEADDSLHKAILERDSQIEALTRDLHSHEQQAASAELKLEQFELLKQKFIETEQLLAQAQAESNRKTDEQGPLSNQPLLYSSVPDQVDDLRAISGIGKKLERTLHDLGIFQFGQLAELSDQGEQWLDDQLGSVKGRVSRDHWVEQARDLMNAKNQN